MAWSPDGQQVAVADDESIWRLPLDDGRPATVVATPDRARCVDWSSEGDLVWLSVAGEVLVAEPSAAQGVVVSRGHDAADWSVAAACRWSPDGTLVAVVSGDGLDVIRRDGTRARATLAGVAGGDATLAWSADGRAVAVLRPGDEKPSTDVLVVEPAKEPTVVFTAPREVTQLAWLGAGGGPQLQAQVGTDSSATTYVIDVSTKQAEAVVGCCQLEPLPDGRFVGFGADRELGWRKLLTLVGPDRMSSTVLARGAAPDPDAPAMSACRGPYLVAKRLAPTGGRVAFVALDSYGPRCDSPVF
jgi:hypothetical protein